MGCGKKIRRIHQGKKFNTSIARSGNYFGNCVSHRKRLRHYLTFPDIDLNIRNDSSDVDQFGISKLIADGHFRKSEVFYVLPKDNLGPFEEIFRAKVLKMLAIYHSKMTLGKNKKNFVVYEAMRIINLITEDFVIKQILKYLDLWQQKPSQSPPFPPKTGVQVYKPCCDDWPIYEGPYITVN